MNDQEMKARLEALYGGGDLDALAKAQYEMAADDIVQEWPQSGERIRGRDNIKAINDNYPAGPSGEGPKMTVRRVLEPGQAWIIEGTIDYGDGVPVSAVSIIETRDGKVVRLTDYFANPFEAPEWRRQWVERMEPAGVR
jgi:SnoaL-like protein